MKKIGLTGGIGSGKTTVAHFFKDFGIPIYIADEKAKELMLRAPIKKEVQALFGADSYDASGQLNRSYIASRVFNDRGLLTELNQIVHPRVREDFLNWANHQTSPYVLYESAILFESKTYSDYIDATILVTAPMADRIARLQKRDQATVQQIKARMRNQWSDEQKIKLADWVIENENLGFSRKEAAKIHTYLV